STSSHTCWSTLLSLLGLSCSSRICSDRRSGRPASWSVLSWRVNVVSCLVDTPPTEKPDPLFFFFLAVKSSPPPFAAHFCSRHDVGKNPCCLIFWIASSLEFASIEPFWAFPAALSAS